MDSIRVAETTKPAGVTRVKKKTVLIVDDHPLLRQGLALLINREHDLTVCGEAEEAQAAMREIAAVSYTHLDVYKRQASISANGAREMVTNDTS